MTISKDWLPRCQYESAESIEIERMLMDENLRSSTTLRSMPLQHYDPIFTPILTTAFTTIGFSAATAATLAGVTTAIATTAISIGIQMLLAPTPPKPDDGKVPMTQAVPSRHWIVGRQRVSGAYMLWEAKGKSLYAVQALAGHRIRSVNRWWLHDDEITDHIGPTGYTNYSHAPYEDNVRVFSRLGLAVETPYSEIVDGYAGVYGLGAENVWTDSHIGHGTASIAMVAQQTKAESQNSMFPYGVPRASVEVDGAYVWDFRDSAQNPEDDSTWTWTRNGALIMAWHQCFNPYGERKDYRKAILPVLDMWQEEADVCDEDVPTAAGGTEKRYWVSGWDTTEHDPKVGTNAILSAIDGWICYRGDGAVLLTVGKFRESRVATLTDADLLGFNVQHDVLPQDECNRLVPKFNYPDTDYSESDTDFFEDEEAQATIGRVLSKEASYLWCTQWRQARRLGKRDWLRIQPKVRGSFDVRLSGLNSIYARWTRLSTPLGLPELDGELIENKKSVVAVDKGGFTMDWIKHPTAEEIEAWDPATDEGQQPPVPSKPNPANLDQPVIYSAVPNASGSGSVYLAVKIVDPEDTSLSLKVRYRLANAGGGVPGEWVYQTFSDFTPSGGYVSVSTNTVPGDTTLEVQAVWFTSKGKYSDYSATVTVFTTSDPVAPGVVTDVTVSTGVGTVNFGWTAPNSGNYAGAKIYWNTTNSFGTASFLGPIEYGSPNTADSATRSISAGTRYAWITTINASGVVESDPVATGAFTVA
ncbi:hypothetical protein [Agrobacterium vitis]|uniref:hypothetical protein n=1 Tax=Agrobacterium vitis TaxID=373 RepID=UPI000AC20675|nr:hypothetical protein [Agrobacterium vitis]